MIEKAKKEKDKRKEGGRQGLPTRAASSEDTEDARKDTAPKRLKTSAGTTEGERLEAEKACTTTASIM